MIRNYLKIALRHLGRHRGYTALNVAGLAVGMATCLLIGLYVQDELSYDTFHPQADQILAVTIESGFFDRVRRIVPHPLGEILGAQVRGVEHVTRTKGGGQEQSVWFEGRDRRIEREQRVLQGDAAFFDVFSGFRIVQGHAASVFDEPDEAVITTSMAETFFGGRNPIGKTLSVDGDSLRRYTVVGVAEVPVNSTVQFDMVVPMADVPVGQRTWGVYMFHTYLRVADGVTPAQVVQSLNAALPEGADRFVDAVGVLPLPDLYLSEVYTAEGFKGQPRYLYIFGTIALLILLIASINYVNLVTAQAEQRTREVGVRKVMGASREQIAYQFVGEALLLGSMALVVAVVLTAGALPVFNALFDKSLSLSTARHSWALLNGIGVVLGVSLLSGTYPAIVLSGYVPTRILRGASATVTGSGGWLRKGLVVTQFAASAGLILGTIVIYQQLNYVQTKNLGFDGEQVVAVTLGDVPERRYEPLVRAARQHTDVLQATAGSAVPGEFGITFSDEPEGFSPAARTTVDEIEIRPAKVDTSFLETLGLRLVAGRDFARGASRAAGREYILNQAAVEAVGWTVDQAIGKPFILAQNEDDPMGRVIGVVRNFHIESLHSPIVPVVLVQEAERFSGDGVLAARLSPGGISAAMDHLRGVVNDIAPGVTFDYTFLDDKFEQMYHSERRLARIFTAFALIAVVVACMGLFALAAFAARRRTREIGIRKALGATAASIVALLSKEYAALLVAAFALGTPVAYLGMHRWLQDFAYRIDPGAGPFVWTAGLAVLVAGLSVSVHALRAARTDPARALRSE